MASGTIKKTPKITSLKSSTSFASQTTLAYTGASFTIPAYCAFSVHVRAFFLTTTPSLVTINESNNNPNTQISFGSGNGITAWAELTGKTESTSVTYYIWAKYASTGNNRVDVNGYYIES